MSSLTPPTVPPTEDPSPLPAMPANTDPHHWCLVPRPSDPSSPEVLVPSELDWETEEADDPVDFLSHRQMLHTVLVPALICLQLSLVRVSTNTATTLAEASRGYTRYFIDDIDSLCDSVESLSSLTCLTLAWLLILYIDASHCQRAFLSPFLHAVGVEFATVTLLAGVWTYCLVSHMIHKIPLISPVDGITAMFATASLIVICCILWDSSFQFAIGFFARRKQVGAWRMSDMWLSVEEFKWFDDGVILEEEVVEVVDEKEVV